MVSDETRRFTAFSSTQEVTHTAKVQSYRTLYTAFVAVVACGTLKTSSIYALNNYVNKLAIKSSVGLSMVVWIHQWLLHFYTVRLAIQLTCVFVDNGLLRLNEGEQVMDMFAKNGYPCDSCRC